MMHDPEEDDQVELGPRRERVLRFEEVVDPHLVLGRFDQGGSIACFLNQARRAVDTEIGPGTAQLAIAGCSEPRVAAAEVQDRQLLAPAVVTFEKRPPALPGLLPSSAELDGVLAVEAAVEFEKDLERGRIHRAIEPPFLRATLARSKPPPPTPRRQP
jgi:hypothetical protein